MMRRGERPFAHGHPGVEAEEFGEIPVVLLPKGGEHGYARRQDFDVVLEDQAPRGVSP